MVERCAGDQNVAHLLPHSERFVENLITIYEVAACQVRCARDPDGDAAPKPIVLRQLFHRRLNKLTRDYLDILKVYNLLGQYVKPGDFDDESPTFG